MAWEGVRPRCWLIWFCDHPRVAISAQVLPPPPEGRVKHGGLGVVRVVGGCWVMRANTLRVASVKKRLIRQMAVVLVKAVVAYVLFRRQAVDRAGVSYMQTVLFVDHWQQEGNPSFGDLQVVC